MDGMGWSIRFRKLLYFMRFSLDLTNMIMTKIGTRGLVSKLYMIGSRWDLVYQFEKAAL